LFYRSMSAMQATLSMLGCACLMVLAVTVYPVSAEAYTFTDQQVEQALDRAYDTGEIQRTLPETEKPEPLRQVPRRNESSKWNLPDLSGLFRVLAYLALGVFVIYLVYLVITHFRPFLLKGSTSRKSARLTGEVVSNSGRSARNPRTKLDQLVAEGRYEEALALLMAMAIELVSGQFPPSVLQSLTSREILRNAEFPDGAQSLFGEIVNAEELSQFAEQPPNRETFELCRNRFDQLSRLLSGVA